MRQLLARQIRKKIISLEKLGGKYELGSLVRIPVTDTRMRQLLAHQIRKKIISLEKLGGKYELGSLVRN
nr:hypothetical protein [Microctonus hyperodae filamentous virus]